MYPTKLNFQDKYPFFSYQLWWLGHYFSHERMHRLAVVAVVNLIAIIGIQLAYPSALTLPRTRIGGVYYGFRPTNSVVSSVNKLNQHQLAVVSNGQKLTYTPEKIGVSIDGATTVKHANMYTWQERLIPFSLLFSSHHVTTYELTTNKPKVQAFVQSLADKNLAALDAQVKVTGTSVAVVPGQKGFTYEAEAIEKQIEKMNFANNFSATITPVVKEPALTTQIAEDIAAKATTRINTPLFIEAGGDRITVEPRTLANWIVVRPRPEHKTFDIAYDRAKIKAKLMTLSSKVYIAETPNRVLLKDGEAQVNNGGKKGQALVLDPSIDEVIVTASNNEQVAQAKLTAITPKTQFVRTYTRSSKGLQALIDYWALSHGGQYGISLKDSSGSIVASYNGSKQFTAASMYKLYLAYAVYSKVIGGQLNLDSITSTGASVNACIDAMIVRSDNPCAVALGDIVGWSANDASLHSKGFGSTSLNSGNLLTTANDTTSWLTQLNDGTLSQAQYNETLLALMQRQIYRSGIPAGSPGIGVANKVGFIGSLNHDAAIVYSPKGTYMLTVLSSGSSFGQIADLARQISTVMNQ
jgi:beta-lactamase class A